MKAAPHAAQASLPAITQSFSSSPASTFLRVSLIKIHMKTVSYNNTRSTTMRVQAAAASRRVVATQLQRTQIKRLRPPRAASGADVARSTGSSAAWRTVEGSELAKQEAASLAKALALAAASARPATTASGATAAAGAATSGSLRETCDAAADLLRVGLSKGTKDLEGLEGAILITEQVSPGSLNVCLGSADDEWCSVESYSHFARSPFSDPPPPQQATHAAPHNRTKTPTKVYLGGLKEDPSPTATPRPLLSSSNPGVKDVRVWQPVFASAGGFPRCALQRCWARSRGAACLFSPAGSLPYGIGGGPA